MNLSITESYRSYSYGTYNHNERASKNRGENPSDFDRVGSETSQTISSDKGKNIDITTVWNNVRSERNTDSPDLSDYTDKEWDNLITEIDRKIAELMGSDTEKIVEYDEDDYIHGNADLLTARYTTYRKSMSYVDPDSSTGEVVDNGYVGRTFFLHDSIVYQQAGYNTKEGGLTNLKGWHVDFENEDNYERTMSFLDRFPEGDNSIFTTRKAFWEDYISGEIDENEFMDFYNTLDHGVANFVKTDENGNNYIDKEMMESKYFKYFGLQQVGMLANETIDREFSTRIKIQTGQGKRGTIDTTDVIKKTTNEKPDYSGYDTRQGSVYHNPSDRILMNPAKYGIEITEAISIPMPYAGNHIVNNKNEYFAMAKDDMIIYQGIVFMCDRLTDTLTLGDVSDPDRCVRVGLTKGGSLLFNRDNAGSLMNALTMFSPDDQERIVKAIQIDNMAQKARKEVEDSKSGENVKSSDEERAEIDTDNDTDDKSEYEWI